MNKSVITHFSQFSCHVTTFVFVIVIATYSALSVSATFINDLPKSKPKRILIDDNDQFYIDYKKSIYVYSDKLEYYVFLRDPHKNYHSTTFDTAISPDGRIFSLMESVNTLKKSKISHYRLLIAECKREKCEYTNLYAWNSGENTDSYSVGKLQISKSNNVFFTATRSYKIGKKWLTQINYHINKRKVSGSVFRTVNERNFPNIAKSIRLVNKRGLLSSDVLFNVHGQEVAFSEKRTSRYTRSQLYDKNGMPHIFFHNPIDRAFYHQFYSKESKTIEEVVIDSAESGWQNIAFNAGDEIWSLHYFYRDAFNKGLAVTRHNIENGLVTGSFVIDASETRNTGWDLIGAKSSNNRILFSYLSNSNNKTREYVMLDDVKNLNDDLGENFSKYGHPQGDGYLNHIPVKNRKTHIAILNSSYSKILRSGHFNFGTGLQRVFWDVKSGEPDEDSNVSTPYLPKYKLSASILTILSAEGKYGGFNFGLEYATQLVDNNVKNSGFDTAKPVNKMMVKVAWNRLLFNYDFAFQFEKTASDVLFTDESNQVASKIFTVDFSEIKFSLLKLNRQHFGYLYQKYNFYQPIYIYKILKDSKSYNFAGQAIGNINVNNHFFHYGHSTVDYITKYETKISQWFFDGEARGGVSLADFKDDTVITGGETPGNEFALAFAAQLEMGYIWYKRWKSLNQLGGVIKLSYRVDYSRIGTSDKPEDKDDVASKDGFEFNFERTELRHGPLVFVSLNF